MKDIRDPLYGFISLNDLEEAILETREFQRLRNIMQLGTSYLIYPSATHTRFEHSLGVLHASTLLFDRLVMNQESLCILGWNGATVQENRQLLRLASMLHDVGHAPFSHAAEELFPEHAVHEDYTRRIILGTTIGQKIDAELGSGMASRVANIAVNDGIESANDLFLSEFLTGDLGSDRLDYLARDSHHLGVSYGRFDAQRFIVGLRVRLNEREQAPELAIEEGAIHTVEGFLLARYFMFLQVYFHKTRRIFDMHLQACLRQILPDGHYPSDIEKFLNWDDHQVLRCLSNSMNSIDVERLLNRKHYRAVFETSEHPLLHEVERFDWLKDMVFERYGVDPIRVDEATKAPYNYKRPPIYVLWRGRADPLQERSALISTLKPISKMRLYSTPELRADVEEFCAAFMRKRETQRRQ